MPRAPRRSGRFFAAIALGRRIAPEVRASGSLRAQAELAVHLASMESWGAADLNRIAEAQRALLEAARLAERAKMDGLRAEALIARLNLYTRELSVETLRGWTADAEAAVERAGNGPTLRVMLAIDGASAFNRAGDFAAARALVNAHLAAVERAFGPESGQVVELLVNLASAKDGLKQRDQAYALVERALAIFARQGTTAERSPDELQSFALIAAFDDHFDRGLELLEASMKARLRSPEPLDREPLRLGIANDWKGWMLERLGSCAPAIAAYREARAQLAPLATAATPVQLARVTEGDNFIGEAHCALLSGEPKQVPALVRQALALGVDDAERHEPHYFLAEALWQLGQRAAARREIERARASLTSDPSEERVTAAEIEAWRTAHP